MTIRQMVLISIAYVGAACAPSSEVDTDAARAEILAVHESMVSAMEAATSTAAYLTEDWRGVNLNGTPMSSEGFEGEDRTMQYDSIRVRERDERVYGRTAALRWHADFFVKVNGQESFAEMRILDVYVLRDGQWLNDLTQVTPVYGTVGNPPSN
jgi:hypothetical protein